MCSFRLPRYKRSPEISSPRLTDRDREILIYVHCHRFLRSDHITALIDGSRQQILRRLQRLYHHGYLERPRCQIDYFQSGSHRIAYGLGNKGAAWLKRELALPFHQLDWKQKNHVGRLFLEHALLISDIMVALELACRKRPDLRLLAENDLNVPKQRKRLHWNVAYSQRLKCGVIPDRVFGLESNGQQCWYFVEADRATMPITRRNYQQSSFQRKLLAYEATWAQKIHLRDFGIHRFRVLTVTTNPERVRKMIEACQRLKHGRGIFLFTDIDSLLKQVDLLSLRWQTAHGPETAGLLD